MRFCWISEDNGFLDKLSIILQTPGIRWHHFIGRNQTAVIKPHLTNKIPMTSMAHISQCITCGRRENIDLIHWGRDKIQNGRRFADDTWSAFSSMEMFEFRLKFHLSLFLRVLFTIFHHCFRSWLGAVQATSHYLNPWWLDYRRIYASLGLNELIKFPLETFCIRWHTCQRDSCIYMRWLKDLYLKVLNGERRFVRKNVLFFLSGLCWKWWPDNVKVPSTWHKLDINTMRIDV